MDTVVGLLMLGVYIVAIVGLAAAITWVVVKVFPTKRDDDTSSQNGTKASNAKEATSSDATPSGRLFRRSKRGSG